MSKVKKNNINKEPTDSLAYKGNVKIKLAKGKTIIKEYDTKNTGTNLLFEGIALGLVGGYVSRTLDSYLPQYIGVGYTQEVLQPTTLDQTDLQAYKLSQVGPRVKISPMNIQKNKEGGYIAPFSAVIPNSTIISANPNGLINEVGLFSTLNTKSLLARIYFEEPIQVSSGMSLIVEWDILIQNHPSGINN